MRQDWGIGGFDDMFDKMSLLSPSSTRSQSHGFFKNRMQFFESIKTNIEYVFDKYQVVYHSNQKEYDLSLKWQHWQNLQDPAQF